MESSQHPPEQNGIAIWHLLRNGKLGDLRTNTADTVKEKRYGTKVLGQ
jgi:hypothetical protein